MRILHMAWDDRRQTFRMPKPESRLLVSQRYFRWALMALVVPALASTILALVALSLAG